MRNYLVLSSIFLTLLMAVGAAAMEASSPSEYGRVVINNHSSEAGLAPVVFDHWLHRSMYTCRLCHVDIGFAMEGGATNITAEGNIQGYYCGSCHDGKRRYGSRVIFASCAEKYTPQEGARCPRCHSVGWDIKKDYDFASFTGKLPQKGLGNRIDWEEAEAKGLIKPLNFLEGVSVKRPDLKAQEDFSIGSKGAWMPDVIFSHKKHAIWNGCEVCHPDIFPNVEKGATTYSMLQIYEGEYCGVCHNKVAFPLLECQRCHTKPVQ